MSNTIGERLEDEQPLVDSLTELEVGQKVRLLKDIWDDGQDHHPPGYLAHKGETLIVRAFDKGHELPVCVSHENVTDSSFRVALDEIIVPATPEREGETK